MKWLRELNIRADIMIAVAALIVSALATAASFWQSSVVGRQLSAQVWPYLSISMSLDSKETALTVSNEGLGPAVVRSVAVTVDGKPQKNIMTTIFAMVGHVPHYKNESINFNATSLRPGSVLRVGATLDLFRVGNDRYATRFAETNAQRLQVRVCYCAIVGECFFKNSSDENPQPVRDCPTEPNELGDPSATSSNEL